MTNQELMSVIEKKYWTEGLLEGRKLEQERIIKLLEDKEPSNITSEQDNFWSGYEMAIALIKGEQK